MLKGKKKLIIIALAAIFCTGGIKGQNLNPSNNGNTPYSRYGFGRLAETSFVRNRAMGGIGIGLRSNMQTNVLNPASYTAIDSLTFLFDFGLNAQIANYKEDGLTQSKWNGGLDYMAMQFPMGKKFSASLGILPFTYVGYGYGGVDSTMLTLPDNTQESAIYTKKYAGDGGLNKAYLGFGAKPFKWMSLGVNVGYIFGEIANSYAVSFTNSVISTSTAYSYLSASAIDLQLGVQFMNTFNEKHEVVVGAVFSPKMNMWVDGDYITSATTTDTISAHHVLNIPTKMGLGATYVYDKRLTVGADFSVEKWGGVSAVAVDNITDTDNTLFKDCSKFALGAEYLPSLTSRNYLKKMRYRLGFNYSESYLDILGSRNKELGITAGLGFPLRSQKSMVNFAVEYTKVNPENKKFLSESYLQFNVGLTFNEFWFFKNKLK
ncbi:MAG: hypothetical protein Q4F97_06310 [Bacteroidales bacterium]|nr:hypothetical protein [Bacteroidales bacterium]